MMVMLSGCNTTIIDIQGHYVLDFAESEAYSYNTFRYYLTLRLASYGSFSSGFQNIRITGRRLT